MNCLFYPMKWSKQHSLFQRASNPHADLLFPASVMRWLNSFKQLSSSGRAGQLFFQSIV